MTVTSNLDLVRLAVGDTDESDPILFDDEIDALLTSRSVVQNGGTIYNVPAAAADAAGAIAAKYARRFSFATDGQSFQVAQQHGQYLALERTLRAKAGGVSVPLSLAGTASTS